MERDYQVQKYTLDGKPLGCISGMGRNKGTWDAGHSYSRACHYARILRREDPNHLYEVEHFASMTYPITGDVFAVK